MTRRNLLLQHDTWHRVHIRVVYRLIERQYHLDPDYFLPFAPDSILSLGRSYQLQFPHLLPWFHYYARNVAGGYTCAQLRDLPIENTIRAIAKRRPVPRR